MRAKKQITLKEIYKQDPIQRVIDESRGWGAEQMLKAGVPIFYRSDKYPETKSGNLFVKELPNRLKFLVKKELTSDNRLTEEIIKPLNCWIVH